MPFSSSVGFGQVSFRSPQSATELPSYRFRHFLRFETCSFDNQCDQLSALCLVQRGGMPSENASC
jgi:hypothetical protein